MTEPPIFITGGAGTGKTTRLIQLAKEHGTRLACAPHEQVLAMAVMHGARRRLERALNDVCPKLPKQVSTLHSFALGLVNRWRRTLGINNPLAVVPENGGFLDKHLRTQVTFEELIKLAIRLLESRTVAGFIGGTYPLIIVDEFQDCAGPTLELIKTLSRNSKLLLAGDAFQLLDAKSNECEAVQWIESLRKADALEYIDLQVQRRTDVASILEAARRVREQEILGTTTIPVFCGAKPAMLAWRMVERFISTNVSVRITGTCAVICPGRDPLLSQFLDSFGKQLLKHSPSFAVRWLRTNTHTEDEKMLLKELGISNEPSEQPWSGINDMASARARVVRERSERFAKLRGIDTLSTDFVASFARYTLHSEKAHTPIPSRYEVTTIHGAKNREFDHVFIFWGYKVAPDTELQRRLLYNAITRARKQCVVLVMGDIERFGKDPVLSLLGQAQAAIQKKKAKQAKPQ